MHFFELYRYDGGEDHLCSRPRTGGPRKTTPAQDALIIQTSAQNCKLTGAQISRILGKTRD